MALGRSLPSLRGLGWGQVAPRPPLGVRGGMAYKTHARLGSPHKS